MFVQLVLEIASIRGESHHSTSLLSHVKCIPCFIMAALSGAVAAYNFLLTRLHQNFCSPRIAGMCSRG